MIIVRPPRLPFSNSWILHMPHVWCWQLCAITPPELAVEATPYRWCPGVTVREVHGCACGNADEHGPHES